MKPVHWIVSFIIIIGVFLAITSMAPDRLFVAQHVEPHTESEINSDHTKYTTHEKRIISGYFSNWKGDLNNTAAIEKDYSTHNTLYCDVETEPPCAEIKSGDILSVKHSVWHGYEVEIIGSILT